MKQLLKLNDNIPYYWNLRKPMSYGAYMIIAIGGRGIGKTTNALIDCMRNFFNKGEEFIYLRRYKPELKVFMNEKTLSNIVDGVRYKGDGGGGYDVLIDDKICAHLHALSLADNYKSTNFSKVTTIIYDEAILKPKSLHRYLNKEVEDLLNYISSIQRLRNNIRIIILGNNLDLFNPYFEYFNIPAFENIYYDKERGLYCELCKNNPQLVEKQMQTSLYKLTKGTRFADFHYDNKLLTDTKYNLMDKKPKDSRLYCRLVANDITLNLYIFNLKSDFGIYVELRDKVIKDDISYIILENNTPNYFNVTLFRKNVKSFIARIYCDNQMFFESKKSNDVFNAIWEVI